ncbi:bacteriocin fulvocin C-related protein [Planomonospora parontospora]
MANLNRLPQDYVTFSQHTAPYRRAIYAKLDPSVRSRLWIDHFAQYRRAHPDLSPRQQRILADLEAYVRIPSNLHRRSPDEDRGDERLKFEVIDAFGKDEARNLVANLGPAESARTAPTNSALAASVDCECSIESDWCGGSWKCFYYRDCRNVWDGCGWLYSYDCIGMCMLKCTGVAGDDSPSINAAC